MAEKVVVGYDGSEHAKKALQTAIDWGRYAELFAYDYDSGEFYLEEAQEE